MGVRSHEGEYHFLGYFESEEAAALAYDQAVREIRRDDFTPLKHPAQMALSEDESSG